MSQVVSFEDFTPPARYDDTPWTTVQIYESATSSGTFDQIDEVTLDPVDTDPSQPLGRDFSTALASDGQLWYQLVWVDASLAVSQPSVPIQNVPFEAYASRDEFFRILKVRQPTAAQQIAADRVLATASGEINEEIDLADGSDPLAGWQLELVRTVCLDRAADLWRHTESAPGILGIVDEGVQTTPGRYSFARYTARLSVLKDQWGVA